MQLGGKRCESCSGKTGAPETCVSMLCSRFIVALMKVQDGVTECLGHYYHACFMALANVCTGNVFNTSSLVSQARRACNTPKRILSRWDVWWESVLITILTPCRFANFRWRSLRSSRSG